MAAPALLVTPAHAQMCNNMGFCNPRSTVATPPSFIDPYWPNVKLLMSFDTGFIDESSAKHGVATKSGGAYISTAQSVFGGKTAYFDGSGTISFPDSEDWNLSNRKFTLEYRLYMPTITTLREGGEALGKVSPGWIVGQWSASPGNCGWGMYSNDKITFDRSTTGQYTTGSVVTGKVISLDSWYAVCIDRDGMKTRVYVDGVIKAVTTNVVNIFNSGSPLMFGNNEAGDKPIVCFLDEFRLTMDVARYASDSGYQIATQPFPRG